MRDAGIAGRAFVQRVAGGVFVARVAGGVFVARAAGGARAMRAIRMAAVGVVATIATVAALAQAPSASALDARLKRLEVELRCLVCQNQTLADSDAPLAADLRREVRELAVAGKSDDEIRAFLTARYGDFVLYKPPVQRNTWLLWFGPFVLLAGGALMWWRIGRGSADALVAPDATPTDEQDAATRGQALLK